MTIRHTIQSSVSVQIRFQFIVTSNPSIVHAGSCVKYCWFPDFNSLQLKQINLTSVNKNPLVLKGN